MDFVAGSESVRIAPTTGVRQGDALSPLVFNLEDVGPRLLRLQHLQIGVHRFLSVFSIL